MCEVIRLRNKKTISTVREFEDYFKVEIPKYDESDEIIKDSCLCQINLKDFLRYKPFKWECGDWVEVKKKRKVLGEETVLLMTENAFLEGYKAAKEKKPFKSVLFDVQERFRF